MAIPSAEVVLGKVTSIEAPDGATVHVLPTGTGRILVGKNNSGGGLTVVVSGPIAAAMTWGDFWGAALEGGEALAHYLLSKQDKGSGCVTQTTTVTAPGGLTITTSQSVCPQ